MTRSFAESDGEKRLRDLSKLMKPNYTKLGQNHVIFPAEDNRILRVMRKVVRGLCHYHNYISPVSENRVWIDVLRYQIPKAYFQMMNYHHRERDIAEYWFALIDDELIHSAWLV